MSLDVTFPYYKRDWNINMSLPVFDYFNDQDRFTSKFQIFWTPVVMIFLGYLNPKKSGTRLKNIVLVSTC